jgi:hypothetical protein
MEWRAASLFDDAALPRQPNLLRSAVHGGDYVYTDGSACYFSSVGKMHGDDEPFHR